MEEKTFKKNYSMQSLHKAMQILRVFTVEQTRLSMTDIHHLTGLSKPSLQRLLSTLVYEGLLNKNEETKKYQLGLELFFLGQKVEVHSNLLAVATPILNQLQRETGESFSLNLIENDKRKCIGVVKSTYELQSLTYVGHESPLYAGASAKLLLAYSDEEFTEDYLTHIELQMLTDKTITVKENLREELRKIRENGFAISFGERLKGVVSISVPIMDPVQRGVAGLSVIIPTPRYTEGDEIGLVKLLKQGAASIEEMWQ